MGPSRLQSLTPKANPAPQQEYASGINPEAHHPESPASSLSPAVLDEELERVQQSTSALEEDWTCAGGAGFSFTQEIEELNLRLSLLEQELRDAIASADSLRAGGSKLRPHRSPLPERKRYEDRSPALR